MVNTILNFHYDYLHTSLISFVSLYKIQVFANFCKTKSQLCKDSNNFPHIQYSHLPQELFKERPPSNILEAADNRALICTYEWLSPHLDVIGWLKTSLFSLPGWTRTTSKLAKNCDDSYDDNDNSDVASWACNGIWAVHLPKRSWPTSSCPASCKLPQLLNVRWPVSKESKIYKYNHFLSPEKSL